MSLKGQWPLIIVLCICHTEPPTAVRNLTVVDTTSTSVTIVWEDPEDVGRPDYYYVIEYSDPDDASIYHRHNEDGVKGNSYTLDKMRPDTIYIIRVTVHNGVSNQDSENAIGRMVSVKGHTAEGRKYTVPIICIVHLSI